MSGPPGTVSLLVDIRRVVGRAYYGYLGLLLFAGLLEGLTLASVVPLLGAIGVGSGAPDAGGTLGAIVHAVLNWLAVETTVLSLGSVVLVVLLLSTLVFLAQAYVGARLQTTYVFRWQQRLTSAIFRARWQHLAVSRQGELASAVITEVQRLGGAFYQAGLLITGVVHALLFLAISAALSGAITTLIIIGSAILFVVTRPLVRRAYRAGAGVTSENSAVQSVATELLGGVKLVKAMATEPQAVSLIVTHADRLRRYFLANAFDVQVIRGVFEFGAAAVGAGVLVVSGPFAGVDPAVTLVVLAIFVRMMPKLTAVQHSLQSLSFSTPALEAVQRIARETEAQAEAARDGTLPGDLAEGPVAVTLERVDVRYGETEALRGVDLHIPRGTCMAIVGGSGAGKSTLVDAMLGLVPVAHGRVLIEGVPLDELPLAALRRRVGYMGQETVLYNASIGDNITWGRPGIGQTQLDASARLAGARDFIASLPREYDTPVGDRGGLLSGGERQRIALARAALGEPGLLILDEATSALDAETERAVTEAVAALKGRTTVVVVAHRLSSARIADSVCVLEQGRIVEQGTWDALLRADGRLAQLWRLQHAGERAVNAGT